MGQLLSRVRQKTSITDVLEQVEKEIQILEKYQRSTERKQKYLVGSLILYSFIIYIAVATFFFFYWFPSTRQDQLLYSIPFLLFPVLILILKKVLQKFFRWKIEMNADQLTELLSQRRAILNDVKENETYKKAKEILAKYDPEYKLQEKQKKDAEELLAKKKEVASGLELRRRSVPVPIRPLQTANVPPGFSGPLRLQQNGRQWIPPPSGPPMARLILPRERGVTDRLVDYIVGDGPNNRYALICKQCCSHNGMALREEFEYIAFRCCYCYMLNPPRKQRPEAPSLPIPVVSHVPLPAPSQTSESEDESQKGESEGDTVIRDETVQENTDPETENNFEIIPDSEDDVKIAEESEIRNEAVVGNI